MWIASIVIAAAFAQASPEADGLTPYVFKFRDGEKFYALADEIELNDENDLSIQVLIDEPWIKTSHWESLQRSMIDEMTPDEPFLRKERIEQAWKAAGGIKLNDRDEQPYWVLQDDLDKQKRAEALERAAFTEAAPASEAPGPSGPLKAGGAQGPGFLRLWGAHAAVIGAALALAGGVLWFALRRS